MSSPIVITALFVSSVFLISSIPKISADNSLITEACSSTFTIFDHELCNQGLGSDPNISSATNARDFTIRIIEAAIANATNTQAYFQNILKNMSSTQSRSTLIALQVCNHSYDAALVSLNSALNEIVNIYEYQMASYDLLIASTDNMDHCRNAVAEEAVTDAVVLIGVRVVSTYGLAAFKMVERLELESRTAPPPGLPPWSHV